MKALNVLTRRYVPVCGLLAAALVSPLASAETSIQVDENASIADTATSISGIARIRLVVTDLDSQIAYFKASSGLAVSKTGSATLTSDAGEQAFRYADLDSATLTLRLVEFLGDAHQQSTEMMAVQGPGMTHTCFQAKAGTGLYDKFLHTGAKAVSRGGELVDLGGYGVRYAYVRDPEGNMLELEELENKFLEAKSYDSAWRHDGSSVWITQAAIATPDIDRLLGFYSKVLGIPPYRRGSYSDHPQMDKVAGMDNIALDGGWFRMGPRGAVLELWQYRQPQTAERAGEQAPDQPGYSFVLQVDDIHAEYDRLQALNLHFLSPPSQVGDEWLLWAHDPDGNLFGLAQSVAAAPLKPRS